MTDTIARPDATIIHTAPADTVNGVNVAETTEQPAQQSTIDAVAVTEPGTRECVEVDPTTLIIGDNVRAAAHLDRQFLASLREFGVMDPIHVSRDQDGALIVKRGQRRTLGAVKVGLPTVPVLVVVDDASEADRITRQWHENERRDALTETDRLAAVEQLTILGVPAGAIAKRLGTPKKLVEAAVQANGSDLAKTSARKHALTLTDAALIAEFEDDHEVVADLLRAVKDGASAEHVAQRARDERARRETHDAAVAALVEAGVTVIDHPGYGHTTIKELREIRLLNRDGSAKKKAPTEAEHATCPGHAAHVTTYYTGTPHVTYVCTDPKANQHALYSWNGEPRLPGQQTGGGMNEEQKAERRTVVANNKAWDSCTTIRKAWLTESFLTRTSPPKGAETFLATAVAYGEHSQDYHQQFLQLTGNSNEAQPWEGRSNIAARVEAASPRQIIMLALALLVSEWESTLSRNTWRRPSDRDRRYLTALIGWGYKPSEVEQIILTKPEPADVIDADPDTKPGDGDGEAGSEADTEADTEADSVPIDGGHADVDNVCEA